MINAVKELLKRPVAYHPILAKLTGSVPAAVMLSQGMYWQGKAEDEGKEWFWVTGDGWFEQCGLTQSTQNTAREILRSTGFWFEKREGLPAKLFYQIDAETLISHITSYLNGEKQVYRNTVNKKTETREASSGRFGKQVTDDTGTQESIKKVSKSKKEESSFPNAEKASAPKTPWTKEVSSLFDKINEEAHRAANLEYGPFNWTAGGGRQFAALKKIRDAMIPDIERKLHHAPDEKEIQSGFEYLFRYGFEFFKKVADDKGGAINFTPSAVLNSYNLILSHARASHTPRKSKQEQRIDDQHEARAAFYRNLVSDLVETGDAGG